MPADPTAAELIALLREHPVCRRELGIAVMLDGLCWVREFRAIRFSKRTNPRGNAAFIRWLTGAAVEKHIELDIAFPSGRDGEWVSGPDFEELPPSECKQHPTFLHAALAALEQHAKESK